VIESLWSERNVTTHTRLHHATKSHLCSQAAGTTQSTVLIKAEFLGQGRPDDSHAILFR
jgi:hypothetical protein